MPWGPVPNARTPLRPLGAACGPAQVSAPILKPRVMAQVAGFLLAAGLLAGCQSAPSPDWVHQRPPSAEEPFVILWLKNNYFHPIGRLFAVDRHLGRLLGETYEASDVRPDGSVPDSSFYTSRDIAALTPAQLFRGPTTEPGPTPPFTVTKVKHTGAAAGFFGTDAHGAKFLFKLDLPDYPELTTGAEVVGSRLLWALGYNVPEMYIVTVEGTGDPRFDGKRAMASRFLPGEIVGPFKFFGLSDRREMRALKLAMGWINNIDCTDFNTLMTWDPETETARYWLLDFSSSLGASDRGPKRPKQGWEYTWDVFEQITDFVTLGLDREPYDKKARPFSPAVGLFDDNYDPHRWKPLMPNMAFWDMTEADGRWMAVRISRFTPAHIRAAIRAGHYSDPTDRAYLLRTLLARQATIERTFGVELIESAER